MSLLMIALVLFVAVPASAGELSLIPQPVKVTKTEGFFILRPETRIEAPPRLEMVAARLRENLGNATGFPLPNAKRGSSAIVLKLDPGLKSLGGEGYRLTVTDKQVVIAGSEPNGVFYGIQTLRQLLPPAIYRRAAVKGESWQIPAVTIEDYPRFSWR